MELPTIMKLMETHEIDAYEKFMDDPKTSHCLEIVNEVCLPEIRSTHFHDIFSLPFDLSFIETTMLRIFIEITKNVAIFSIPIFANYSSLL